MIAFGGGRSRFQVEAEAFQTRLETLKAAKPPANVRRQEKDLADRLNEIVQAAKMGIKGGSDRSRVLHEALDEGRRAIEEAFDSIAESARKNAAKRLKAAKPVELSREAESRLMKLRETAVEDYIKILEDALK